MLILNLDVQGENLYARLVGKLTKKETYKFHHCIIPYIQKEKIKNFICDCKELSKIDSEGKYALLKTKITMKKQKGNFLLCDVKDDIKKSLIGYRMRIH